MQSVCSQLHLIYVGLKAFHPQQDYFPASLCQPDVWGDVFHIEGISQCKKKNSKQAFGLSVFV